MNYLRWSVLIIHQLVARQRGVMVPAASVIKPPVFGDAKGGIPFPFLQVVPATGPAGCNLQNEFRWLANLAYHVAVAGHYGGRVYSEGHKTVGS